jgi:ankyrin repeat protein
MLRSLFKFVLYLALMLGFSAARAGAYEDFFKAITFDDARTVTGLLERGFDPNARDEKGQTPLYLSLREGSFKAAAVLLSHPQLRIDLANNAGETALMICALKGQTEWLQKLIDRGATLDSKGPKAWTALHYAASGPTASAVQLLLARGAQIDARSPNGSTPLMMASRYGPEDAVQRLLKQGADVRLRNDLDLDAADFARQAGREALAESLQRAAR